MKLTGNILIRSVQEEFSVAYSKGVEKSGWLSGPLLYRNGEQLKDGWVYVVGPGYDISFLLSYSDRKYYFEGQEETENCLLIFTEGKQEEIASLPCAVLLEDSPEPGAVINRLVRAYALYEEWEKSLLEVQYRLGTVEEMLKLSLPVFRDPLLVLGKGLLLVSVVSEEEEDGKAGIFVPGRERMDIINAMIQDADFSKNRKRGDSYWGPEYLLGFRSICWNVIRNDETQYTLMVVEEGHRLSNAEMDLLSILGFHIKYVLYYHEGNRNRSDGGLGKTLRRILEDRTYDYMEASRHLAESGWTENHRYMCLLYQLTYLDQKSLPVVNICRFMEEQYPYCCSFAYQDEIITFFNLTLGEQTEEEIQNQLKPFIRDSYLKAGFSRCVEGHMELRRQYVQAKISIDVGSRRNPYQWIHYFDRVVQPYILEQITRRLPGPMLVHKGILRLQESDRTQNTDYMKTLKVYLDNQQNATQTAKELYIHRSTFLYRMERIMDLLESDLQDPEEVLYLSLSFRILNYKG
ncbi:MAG: helix-turn-helix domain-containing protein [Lachnospiraceae bacterium]|nr:helix-turn-helix domain-containing protein [Lachnospiraceae bacterium]